MSSHPNWRNIQQRAQRAKEISFGDAKTMKRPVPPRKRRVIIDAKPERVPISTPVVKRDRITLAKLKFMGE